MPDSNPRRWKDKNLFHVERVRNPDVSLVLTLSVASLVPLSVHKNTKNVNCTCFISFINFLCFDRCSKWTRDPGTADSVVDGEPRLKRTRCLRWEQALQDDTDMTSSYYWKYIFINMCIDTIYFSQRLVFLFYSSSPSSYCYCLEKQTRNTVGSTRRHENIIPIINISRKSITRGRVAAAGPGQFANEEGK